MPISTDLLPFVGSGAVLVWLWLLDRLLHRYNRTPRQCHVCLAFRHRRDRALRGGVICICCAQQQRCARRAGLEARYWQTVRACQQACLRGPALWRRVGMELFLMGTDPGPVPPRKEAPACER
jgi:hypothetical protein